MRSLLSLALNPGASEVMYEHVGGVLCNITQHELGRKLLAEGELAGMRAAVSMLGARSTVLRTGAAAAVKNMIMSAHPDGWFEQLISSRDLLEQLLVCRCLFEAVVPPSVRVLHGWGYHARYRSVYNGTLWPRLDPL